MVMDNLKHGFCIQKLVNLYGFNLNKKFLNEAVPIITTLVHLMIPLILNSFSNHVIKLAHSD